MLIFFSLNVRFLKLKYKTKKRIYKTGLEVATLKEKPQSIGYLMKSKMEVNNMVWVRWSDGFTTTPYDTEDEARKAIEEMAKEGIFGEIDWDY